MKNTLITLLSMVFCALFLANCAVENSQPQTVKTTTDELVFAANPEPAKGKIDVYASMARTVKYNVDVASQNLNKKIYNQDPNLSPRDIIRNVMNVKTGDENPLYDSSRVLDFSVIYAMAVLNDANRQYVENNFYAKSSQHLALAAIRSHQDTLFATKKIKEINRLVEKEGKILKDLNDKMKRNGVLTNEELEQKKGIEVGILKLSELKNALAFNMVEYTALVKAEANDLELEGRRFYELEDFDRRYTLKTFQEAAVRGRNEFAIGKELNLNYTYEKVEQKNIQAHPEIERLQVNGFDVKDPIYADNLQARALKIANSLVETVIGYQKVTKPEEKQALKVKAFDELGVAIFAQIEVAFNIVKLSDLDYAEISKQVSALKKEIKDKEKSYRLSRLEKVEILNKKIKLLGLELKASQVLAERAVALRSLYFYSGFSPFNKALLKGQIADITTSLKTAFNKDLIEVLAATPEVEDTRKPEGNVWAKGDDWLEVLMENKKPENDKIEILEKPDTDFSPYESEAFDKLKIMQLGSYRNRENAELEWSMLQELYPDFATMSPKIEETTMNGKPLFRLMLESADGGFRQMCNRLRGDRVECLLR